MRVLVCGGRDFMDGGLLERVLNDLNERPRLIIEGGAKGADSLARSWARMNRVEIETYPAMWERDGKAAGPIRNQAMLVNGRPDLVVAFPGGRGTADMVRRAKAAGVKVQEVSPKGMPSFDALSPT